MSIFANLFGVQQQNPQAPQQPSQQQNPSKSNEPTMGSKDPGQQVTPSDQKPDPAAMWNKLWDTSNTGSNTDGPPQLTLDPKVLDQVSGQLDFMSGVNPELLQKATGGDIQALLEIVQHVGRSSYKQALSHNGALTNEFVSQREGHFSKQLPNQIKTHLTENMLTEGGGSAPPFIQQQMRDVASRIQKANPDATPAQIQGLVKQYMQELAGFAQQQFGDPSGSTGTAKPQADKPVDWNSWFGDSPR